MAEWIITLQGEPQTILDEHCFRDLRGEVSSWLFGNGVYTLTGEHVGWFEAGALFDIHNQIIGKIAGALPAQGMAPAIDMPVFQRRPQVPKLRARHPRIWRDDKGARAAVYSIETALSNEKLSGHRMRPALRFERACM